MRDESHRLAIIIENKVQTIQRSAQLARYHECASRECCGWKIVPIYLTVDSKKPTDEGFIPFKASLPTRMGYPQSA